MKYWLVKSDPGTFSIDDLEKSKDKTTCWSGVRNYMRDEMKKGDAVLFYHSNTKIPAVMGTCKIVKEGYPDYTAFDPEDDHFDPAGSKENPVWIMVDIKLEERLKRPVTLNEIRQSKRLSGLKLVQPGNRLSVMPVKESEYKEVIALSRK